MLIWSTASICEENIKNKYEICLLEEGEKIEREMVKKIEKYKKEPMKNGRNFAPKLTRAVMRGFAIKRCADY